MKVALKVLIAADVMVGWRVVLRAVELAVELEFSWVVLSAE